MGKEQRDFPDDFVFGTAVAGHQSDGGIDNSDWEEWEKGRPSELTPGKANEFYSEFKRHFSNAEKLGTNAIRLSVEWSRIEPVEGKIDEEVLRHYGVMLKSAREHGLKPMVTLNHFVLPAWLAEQGGWKNKKTASKFKEHVGRVKDSIVGDQVEWWVTINEPNIYVLAAHLVGVWPPQERNPVAALRVYNNMAEAHILAAGILKSGSESKPVGVAIQMMDFRGFGPFKRFVERVFNKSFYNKIGDTTDFSGVNYYRPAGMVKGLPMTDFGWPIDPNGFTYVINQRWADSHKPIYITENGIADEKDTMRPDYLITHLWAISNAIRRGIDIRGYFHWSLMDNFEWDSGWKPKFGLYTRDGVARPSAAVYAKICRTGRLPNN